MSRSLLFLIVVFVVVFTVGQAGPALARNPHQIPGPTGQIDTRSASGGRDGSPLPRRGAVLINGKLVSTDQFFVDEFDLETCQARHLHPQSGNSVTAFDGTVIIDPEPWGCGYGKIYEVIPYRVFVTDLLDEDFDGIPAIHDGDDHNPDINGNGVPDGADDTDGDGLTDAWEYWVSRTLIGVADSDGNGNDDSVDHTLSIWKHRFHAIPVLVNLYTGSCSSNEAFDAISKANIVLKQAGVRLQFIRHHDGVTLGDDGSGGGTANDGILTEEEFRKAAIYGRGELYSFYNFRKRGLKIIFAQLEPNGQYAAGASLLRVPVIAVAPNGRNAKEIGATIAHEFFHSATIDGHPEPGSAENTPGNVMIPWDEGRDIFVNSNDADKGLRNLTLTPTQLETVLGGGMPSLYGLPGTRRSPAVKRQYQRGSAVDDLGDSSGPGYLDLHTIDMASHTDDEDIHMLLKFGGLFPDTGDIDAVYRLRFDIDDDLTTGEVGVIPGIDRTITIFVERNAGTPGLVVGAELSAVDPPGGTLLAPVPQLLTVDRITDRTTIPNLPTAAIFELHMPKDLLGMTAANVPGSVESFESVSSLSADVVLVDYDRELWLNEPTLSIPVEFAERDELVPFSLSGMTPGDPYELFVDDTLVHSGTLDAFGEDAGDFIVPAAQPYDFSFLTAIDDTGLIAASAIVVADPVFSNGFESGDTGAWSSTSP